MSTERVNASPAIIPRVLSERLWGDHDFFLLDVGASGGIEKHWAVFNERLRAIGFEPLLAEVERLQNDARGTKISYEPAFVTCGNFDQLFPPDLRQNVAASKNNDPFQRVSAVRALQLLQVDYTEQMFNAGAPVVYTDRRIVLDEFFPAYQHGTIDFVKIDTDGHDFEVLLGADAVMRNGGSLGCSIEAQFHGASHDYANTFANIDRFMRAHGFSLFDIDVYRYSRAALPAPFMYDIPAQTTTGQVLWGEALYFRDLADQNYARMWPYYLLSQERVIKLACLFDLFGLPDCAAELLATRRDVVGEQCDALLDDLAAPGAGTPGAYAAYLQAFESDPKAWLRTRWHGRTLSPGTTPSHESLSEELETEPADAGSAQRLEPARRQSVASVPATIREASEVTALRRRVARLLIKTRELRQRLRQRDHRVQQLKQRLAGGRARQDGT
jgi:hypothetical protein